MLGFQCLRFLGELLLAVANQTIRIPAARGTPMINSTAKISGAPTPKSLSDGNWSQGFDAASSIWKLIAESMNECLVRFGGPVYWS